MDLVKVDIHLERIVRLADTLGECAEKLRCGLGTGVTRRELVKFEDALERIIASHSYIVQNLRGTERD